MKKALMIGVMTAATAMFGASHSASAKSQTYSYGFGTPSGGQYCDGVDFTASKSGEAVGLHTYYQTYCPYKSTYIGGYGGSVKALGKGTWYSLTASQLPGSPEPELYTIIYYINPSSSTWALAVESSYEQIPFELVNSGVLTAPLDAAHRAKAHLGSLRSAAIAKLRSEGKVK